jgi:hypothetical protein
MTHAYITTDRCPPMVRSALRSSLYQVVHSSFSSCDGGLAVGSICSFNPNSSSFQIVEVGHSRLEVVETDLLLSESSDMVGLHGHLE